MYSCKYFCLFKEDVMIYFFVRTGMFFPLFEVENSIFNLFFSLCFV